jgi:ubiquinone/menaquinone biosynthesis C-methylase UbiE
MKKINSKNINTKKYWDVHIAKPDFGLRQKKYLDLAGKGNKIIELGCGLSPFLSKARKNFQEAWGLDFSPITVAECLEKYPTVNYILADAVKTPFPDKWFDVTVAGELIEHLKEPEKLITEMVRITKKRIILSTAKMEYNDPEHLWEFNEDDFPFWNVETVKSKRFPGRSYLFITIDL